MTVESRQASLNNFHSIKTNIWSLKNLVTEVRYLTAFY
jgi:hypothetical protein